MPRASDTRRQRPTAPADPVRATNAPTTTYRQYHESLTRWCPSIATGMQGVSKSTHKEFHNKTYFIAVLSCFMKRFLLVDTLWRANRLTAALLSQVLLKQKKSVVSGGKHANTINTTPSRRPGDQPPPHRSWQTECTFLRADACPETSRPARPYRTIAATAERRTARSIAS